MISKLRRHRTIARTLTLLVSLVACSGTDEPEPSPGLSGDSGKGGAPTSSAGSSGKAGAGQGGAAGANAGGSGGSKAGASGAGASSGSGGQGSSAGAGAGGAQGGAGQTGGAGSGGSTAGMAGAAGAGQGGDAGTAGAGGAGETGGAQGGAGQTGETGGAQGGAGQTEAGSGGSTAGMAGAGQGGGAGQTGGAGSGGSTAGMAGAAGAGQGGDAGTAGAGGAGSGGGAAQPDPVTLPLEIFWKNPEETISFTLTAEEAASAVFFTTRLNNINGPDRVAFGFNGGELVNVNKDTVEADGLGAGQDKEGIFKFPSTRDLKYALKPGTLHEGVNTVHFKFNGVIDDPTSIYRFSMGFRVLRFNFKTAQGDSLLPASLFKEDDPAQWETAYSAEQIASGRELWYGAKLAPNPYSQQKIEATCNDCHVDISDDGHDGGGYDLKYFNYSSHAIVSRAQFHQLTADEGASIAAYIRSLPTPASEYGRPWNPPYQPGAVLAQRPVSEWAAGAGVDAIVQDESEVVAAMFPGGSITHEDIALGSGKRIDLSTIPSFPLLDWNEWLPTTHPKDGSLIFVPGQFEKSLLNQKLTAIKASLGAKGTAESEKFIKESLEHEINQMSLADPSPEAKATWDKVWDEPAAQENHSWAKYRLKEVFGLMQKYEIEGRLPEIFGAGSVSKGWLGNTLFVTNAVPINRPDGGRFGIAQPLGNYTATAWYHLQAIVNMGDDQRKWLDNVPVDGAYILDINSKFLGLSGYAGGAQLYGLSLRMMQERASYNDGLLPFSKYDPDWGQDPTRAFLLSKEEAWQQVAPETKRQMLRAIVKAHYDYLEPFPFQDFLDAGLTVPFDAINGNGGLTFLSRLRAILAYMHANDPASPLQMDIATKADAKFPGFAFAKTASGAGAHFVSIHASRKTQKLDPNTQQMVDAYEAPLPALSSTGAQGLPFTPGETIHLKGFFHGDGNPVPEVARFWYQIDGVEKQTLTEADTKAMSSGDGVLFTLDQPGEYVLNVLVESTEGVVSGTRELLLIGAN